MNRPSSAWLTKEEAREEVKVEGGRGIGFLISGLRNSLESSRTLQNTLIGFDKDKRKFKALIFYLGKVGDCLVGFIILKH